MVMDVQCVLASKPASFNSLEFLFPSVAANFDIEKTDFAPSEASAKSAKKVTI